MKEELENFFAFENKDYCELFYENNNHYFRIELFKEEELTDLYPMVIFDKDLPDYIKAIISVKNAYLPFKINICIVYDDKDPQYPSYKLYNVFIQFKEISRKEYVEEILSF